MNVKEYIASGMIESYVMGLLSEPERREFEAVCVQHPEVAAARTAFEEALEVQLLADAKDAPANLKQQLFDRIAAVGQDSNTEDVEEETAPVRSMGAWKWIAVAAIVLMAVAAYWAFDTNNRSKSLQAENSELREKLDQANQQLSGLQPGNGGSPKSDFMMASIKEGSQAAATIYWDTLTKDVYLMVNNMPQPASDKQYQLWALLPQEGAAPIDLGMIEVKQQRLLYRMKNVQNAKAFAITLEPKGGSKIPTGEPMVSSTPVTL